jgi:parallel beta-helix repeat protein
VAEGPFTCINVTVQNNDIGPCGSDAFQQWADGISVSCQNALVLNNMINNPTDGGIVIFGSPGTLVENNTIWVETQTLLGGINMVDYEPWKGNYTNTIVRNNTIMGGFATSQPDGNETEGTNADDVIIKIGIAIGPRTWFGDEYGSNVSQSGTVLSNRLTGAFSYAIAIDSATNFTVEDNVLFGNTSFIGARGPNCTTSDIVPSPAPFVQDQNNVQQSTIQPDFQTIPDADALTCVLPPDGGDYWPYGGNPSASQASPVSSASAATPTSSPGRASSGGVSSNGKTVGLVVGLVLGLLFAAVVAWFVRKWAINHAERTKLFNASRNAAGHTATL